MISKQVLILGGPLHERTLSIDCTDPTLLRVTGKNNEKLTIYNLQRGVCGSRSAWFGYLDKADLARYPAALAIHFIRHGDDL